MGSEILDDSLFFRIGTDPHRHLSIDDQLELSRLQAENRLRKWDPEETLDSSETTRDDP
jgi:hypothetical protein